MAASMTDGIFIARPETPAPGIPLAVKDLFDTAGLTTTYGSALFADHVPTKTAEAVRLLEAAGYANVGKANLHEFAYGITSENPHFGTVPNPLRAGRIAGGSSGGSAAALAAGLADVALGTDSGGSIRIPAACCGIVGFKPTYGAVSLDGCFPLAPSWDHAGPMARTVRECVAMMGVLSPGFRPTEVAFDDVSVGVAWIDEADPLVRARIEAAAAQFPNRRSVNFPLPEGLGPSFMGEVADVHRELFLENRDLYGADVARKIESCLAIDDRERDEAARKREAYREQALETLGDLDLLIVPTLPCVAPEIGQTDDDALRNRIIRFTFPFDALGWPALALPCGPAEEGLPASLQLVGRTGDDARVLAVGFSLLGV
ncbi:MAG: amidase [Actinobacteria bacterium]|nr:amidase [Actinomycetota bacterium]